MKTLLIALLFAANFALGQDVDKMTYEQQQSMLTSLIYERAIKQHPDVQLNTKEASDLYMTEYRKLVVEFEKKNGKGKCASRLTKWALKKELARK